MDAISGVMMMTCAMIMAVGVKSSPSTPNGPERESDRKTISPTTTGGNPISAFSTAIVARLCLNRRTASQVPKGRAMQDAITSAFEEEGRAATPERPLAWVSLETDPATFRHELKVRYWNGSENDGATTLLSHAHPHGAWVEWIGA